MLLAALPLLGCGDAGPEPPSLDPAIHSDPAILATVGAARDAVLDEPASVEARIELAKFFAASDLHQQAREAFEQAVEVGADDARTLAFLAYECHALGDFDAALEHMRAAAAKQPDFAPLSWWIGFWLLESGEPERSIEAFREATRVDPDDVQGWIGLGRATMQLDEPEAALEFLRRAAPLAKARLARYVAHLTGTALQRSGRADEAAAYFSVGDPQDMLRTDAWRKTLREYAVGFHGQLAKARRSLRAGDVEDATATLEAMMDVHPPTRGLVDNLAACYFAARRFQDAVALLRRFEDDPLPTANSWYLLAAGSTALGAKEADVLPMLERSLETNPRFGPTLVRFAEIDLAKQDFERALQRLEVVLADEAIEDRVHVLAARAAEGCERWDRAVEHLENALEAFPGDRSLIEALERARASAAAAAVETNER